MLIAMARCTNGNASASFRPASLVSAKRVSESCDECGSSIDISAASTGSVGARHAPSRTAEAKPNPNSPCPISASRIMQTGITTKSKRVVNRQPLKENNRSIFRPAPISETITMSSVAFSMRTGVSIGRGEYFERGVKVKMSAPIKMQTMGSERGALRIISGNHATIRTSSPIVARIGKYPTSTSEAISACVAVSGSDAEETGSGEGLAIRYLSEEFRVTVCPNSINQVYEVNCQQ